MAQLGDLIVSGKARFLNKISGNIDSADKVNNKLTLTVSGDGVVSHEYDGSSPVSVTIGGVTPAEHTHGNIQNFGTLQTNDITIASGDKLVVTDSSDSSKVARTSISFDGSTATKCLTQKGTWETFASSNTDTKVTQTSVTTSATYSIPLCKTYNTTTETDSLYKNLGINYYINGSQAGLFINEPGKDNASTLGATGVFSYGVQIMSRTSTTATPNVLAIDSTDIIFGATGTWDGTNVSLKAAVTAAKGTVTQTPTNSTNSTYELLFSGTADNTEHTESTKKDNHLRYNPGSTFPTLEVIDGIPDGRSSVTAITGHDITISNNMDPGELVVSNSDVSLDLTWDGTNTSLKTAIKDKVSKSSGTTVDNPISGAIAITDNFFSKVASVDLSKSNNNLSSDYFGLVDFRDKNKKRFGYIQYGVRTSGGTDASLRSVNFPAGGTTEYTNSLTLVTSKAGAYTYSVTNATNFRTAIGAAAASSIKTKENISDLTEDEALKLLEIRPVSFDYKQGFDIDNKYERNYGVIAEETLDIIPSVVNVPTTEGWEFDAEAGTNQELITVDYAKFVPYLIKLVQMQQQEIDELKNR